MFAFEIIHEEDQILPRKWHLEAVIRICSMKKMFISTKSFKKSNAQESFLNQVSGLRPVTLIKKRMFILLILRNFLRK